jgi:hypothetical protein
LVIFKRATRGPSISSTRSSQAPDALPHAFQGFLKRKNRFPVGDVMVMLFVPLLVLLDLQTQPHQRHGLETR